VIDRYEEGLDLLGLEAGKVRVHAIDEILDTAQNARHYARSARRHLKPKRRRGALPVLTQTWEYHHPRGLAGFIAPWNYPLVIGIADALPALVAGNAVLIKPDQQTPLSVLWAVELLEEAGLPEGVAQVVTGSGSELGKTIIDNVDVVMFTGSTAVGRQVAVQAAERLIDSSMELGGKNAMIVLEDADLERTADGAVRASFANSGQLCISMERLYVHDSIYDRLVPMIAERIRSLRLGATLDWEPQVGSLISAKQLDTVTSHIEDAVAKGARVLAGGRPRPDIGPYFHEPTLLENVSPEMTVCANETFGPLLSAYRFSDPDEAVRRANDSPYGLNFSVWSRNTRAARKLGTRLHAGTVNVNDGFAAAWGSTDAPMGGFKDSGTGRRHGAHGITKYTESQTIAVQRVRGIEVPAGQHAEKIARGLLGALKVMRRTPMR
jgi:succinate-semialdehyde dehydrogenase/glutarate-semialdehyde dehydrogenase